MKTRIPPNSGCVLSRVVHRVEAARLNCYLWAMLLGSQTAFAADFTITSPGYYYSINGTGSNPTLTLVRGKTYTFLVNANDVHPFFIRSSGVQNNDISNGTITYTVPAVASNYTYIC